jgi:hypothetical protein
LFSAKEFICFHKALFGNQVNINWLDNRKEQCFIGTRVGDRGAAEGQVNQKETKEWAKDC